MAIVYIFSLGFIVAAILFIAFALSVLFFGRKALITDAIFSALKDLTIVLGLILLIALLMGALYYLVHIIKSLHTSADVQMLLVFVTAYGLGSIPFGLIFTRMAGLGDIRKIGSGNIGATNVLRTGRKEIAALTLFMDGAKGAVAVLFAASVHPLLGAAAGVAALLGHLYPVWLKFKGGKGVATAIGVITAISWPVGASVMALWLISAALFRYSSLAALIALGSSPIIGAFFYPNIDTLCANLVIMMLVFFRHKTNVKRLLDHTEPKIGAR